MTDFSYRLVVLTHAAGGGTLADALAAFEEHASPAPVEVLVVVDGPEFGYVAEALKGRWQDAVLVVIHPAAKQGGFCAATRRAWALAAQGPGPLHVFYLEHDFLLTRGVHLADLAVALDMNPRLAQMALMRNAVNEQEKAAGGLFESRRDEYQEKLAAFPVPDHPRGPLQGWLEHRSYLTTNPSLMRRSFMQEHSWPAYDSECEGRFGIDLVQAGYSFGVWGVGEPWCAHAGVRSGYGY